VNKVGDILYLVVHHSASPLTTTFEDIERWHIEDREWKAIGYNLVVESSGMYRSGRALPRMGSHVKGINRHSIGVCLVGDNTKPGQHWTEVQITRLREIVAAARVFWPAILPVGHRDVAKPGHPTECPGLDVSTLNL
jgi:hypothetical protein